MKRAIIYCTIVLGIFLLSCNEEVIPKKRGYFRIDLPDREYLRYESDCPYSFNYPSYAKVIRHNSARSQPCWIDIVFPEFNAMINVSYFQLNDTNLTKFSTDSRAFAYKHTIKADAISEEIFINNEKRVFGSWYEIKGNAASSLQFYLTDSIDHFFRGALYFNHKPNKDSIAPVVSFIKEDIQHLVESFEWGTKEI